MSAEQCYGCGKFRKAVDLRPIPLATSFLPGDEPSYRCTTCVPRWPCCDAPASESHYVSCVSLTPNGTPVADVVAEINARLEALGALPPSGPYEDVECCASGSCEVCRPGIGGWRS